MMLSSQASKGDSFGLDRNNGARDPGSRRKVRGIDTSVAGGGETEPERAPDYAPSIAEQIAQARGSFFNFTCACCGDHLKYAKVLTKEGLTWPRVWEGLSDSTAFHNLRFREEQAILRIPKDPHGAVAFFEAQIEHEREKLEVRKLREPWDQSRVDVGGAGDLRAFGQLVSGLSDDLFEPMVFESLDAVSNSSAHVEQIVAASVDRPLEVRVRTLALLKDRGLIQGTKYEDEVQVALQPYVSPEQEGVYSNHDQVTLAFDPAAQQQ